MGFRNLQRRLSCRFAQCLLAVAMCSTAVAEGEPPRYDLEAFDPDEIETAAYEGRPCALYFFDASHEVLLEPVDLRSARFRQTITEHGRTRRTFQERSRLFRGHLVDEPDSSVVRISLTDNGVRGYVKSSAGWTFIRPQPQASFAGAHMVYTDGDLDAVEVGSCATSPEHPVADDSQVNSTATAPQSSSADDEPQAETADFKVLELAVEVDFAYFTRYGSSTQSEIDAVLNEVDGIFQSELGVTIEVVHFNIYQDAAEPYTQTNPDLLLDELQDHWNTNNAAIARDAVHLFTGKDLDGTVVGIAFRGVLCNLPWAFGLSQDLATKAIMPILVAHEMGHNLNAQHDPSGSSPRYVMYQSVSSSNLDEYSAESKTQIANHLAAVGCLSTTTDPGSGGSTPPPSGGGGGGGSSGGGPVDPSLIVLAVLAYGGARWQSRRTARRLG